MEFTEMQFTVPCKGNYPWRCRMVLCQICLCVVCRGAILILPDIFTCFSLLRSWAGVEGAAHPGMVCTPQANAWNCSQPIGEPGGRVDWHHFGRGGQFWNHPDRYRVIFVDLQRSNYNAPWHIYYFSLLNMKEISQTDTHWCSIEFGYVVHWGAILIFLDSGMVWTS